MQIGDSISIDGNVTASGKLGGGTQASQAGDAVLLGSDGLIPASLLPSMDSGWVQPYFFLNAQAIPSIIGDTSIDIHKSIYVTPELFYLNQTLFIERERKGTSSGYFYTTLNPKISEGAPIFSRYPINSATIVEDEPTTLKKYKSKTVSDSSLVALLSPYIQSNITKTINLYTKGFDNELGSGSVSLQNGEIVGGTMTFYTISSNSYRFSFSSDWWIS